MESQQTIGKPVTLQGRGLFLSQPATVTFRPAPANHGIVFCCLDQGAVRIPALVDHVVRRPRRTALRNGEAVIETCEHCMSAVAGLQIDNLLIEVAGPEMPGADGSAKPYADVLLEAGTTPCDAPRTRLVVTDPIVVRQDGAMLVALPYEQPVMQILYDLNYPTCPAIGRQLRSFELGTDDYLNEIAPARTYVLEEEAQRLHQAGIGTHLREDDILVMGNAGPLGSKGARFTDEPVRHKIVDLIGDLYLIGAPIQGKIIASKSGHSLNHLLVRRLIRQHEARHHRDLAGHRFVLDVRKLTRIMPHRYPMLLVDRVIEVDSDRRAVGIKNVTINEPYFQGHYPGVPIMPGVLIVEAMAQLSGVLIGRKLEHTGKLPVLMSLDRVKIRRAVTPGDQLVLEAQTVRVRSRIAHMRCRAYVAEDVAAEAEVKFMLVDDDQD